MQEFTSDSDNDSDNANDNNDNNNGQVLYAAANDINKDNPTEEGDGEGEEGKKAPGRPRREDTCTDEYLNERGMKPKKNRYYFNVGGWAENDYFSWFVDMSSLEEEDEEKEKQEEEKQEAVEERGEHWAKGRGAGGKAKTSCLSKKKI